jgi:hypothetical protein
VTGGGAGGAAHWHRRRRWNRRTVAAPDHTLGRLETGERDHLFDVGGAVESDDRRLAQHRLDTAQRSNRVVTDGRSRARPDVGGQPDPFPDRKRGRRLLLRARRTSGLGAWRRPRHGGRDDHGDLLVVLVLVVLVILVIGHDLDVLDGVHLDHVVDDLGVNDLGIDDLLRLVRCGRRGRFAVVGGASGHV